MIKKLQCCLPLKAVVFLLTSLLAAASLGLGLLYLNCQTAGFFDSSDPMAYEDSYLFESISRTLAWDYARHGASWEDAVVTVEDPEHPGAFFLQSGSVPARPAALWQDTFEIHDSELGLTAGKEYLVTVYVLNLDTHSSPYYDSYTNYQLLYPHRSQLLPAAALSAGLALLGLGYLLWAVGWRRDRETIYLNWQDRIPLDLYLAADAIAVWYLVYYGTCVTNFYNISSGSPLTWILPGLGAFFLAIALALAALMTLAARMKAGRMWENTVCCRLFRSIRSFFRILPFTWRTALGVVGYLAVNVFLLFLLPNIHYFSYPLHFWIQMFSLLALAGFNLLAIALCTFFSWQLQQLERTAKALAEGTLEAKADTRRLFFSLRRYGEHLNAIGDGMNRAVEQRMRSERLKTELITNVSHDIKTPLTSIINYVDLLKKEEPEGAAAEYLDILDRQSQRLRKLTEDLVEASKASTGNIQVELQPIGVGEIIDQALGDYDQRLGDSGLQVLVTAPQEGVAAMADGKLLWRVLDNLLGNVCKYALPQSRVYVDLAAAGGLVRLTIKNISREMLNISADELMERFVRGDASRHTEGSGLGLNIAKSLMELMGGSLALSVDGDLFRVDLTLRGA